MAPEDRLVTHMTTKLPPVGSGSAVAQRAAVRGPGRAPPPARRMPKSPSVPQCNGGGAGASAASTSAAAFLARDASSDVVGLGEISEMLQAQYAAIVSIAHAVRATPPPPLPPLLQSRVPPPGFVPQAAVETLSSENAELRRVAQRQHAEIMRLRGLLAQIQGAGADTTTGSAPRPQQPPPPLQPMQPQYQAPPQPPQLPPTPPQQPSPPQQPAPSPPEPASTPPEPASTPSEPPQPPPPSPPQPPPPSPPQPPPQETQLDPAPPPPPAAEAEPSRAPVAEAETVARGGGGGEDLEAAAQKLQARQRGNQVRRQSGAKGASGHHVHGLHVQVVVDVSEDGQLSIQAIPVVGAKVQFDTSGRQ